MRRLIFELAPELHCSGTYESVISPVEAGYYSNPVADALRRRLTESRLFAL